MAQRTLRKLFALHSWAGLVSGSLLLLITLSGSLLLFRHELDPLLYPQRYTVSVPEDAAVSLDSVYHTVRAAYPDARNMGIADLPARPGRPVTVGFKMPTAGGDPARRVSVNPYTSEIFDLRGVRDDFRGDFFGWLLQFHYSLQVRPFGDLVAGLLSISLLLSLATGFWVFRKQIGKVLLFRLPLRLKNWRTASSSLHRIVGVWALLFNAMMALTALWILKGVFTPSFYAAYDAEQTVAPGTMPEVQVSLDSLVTAAEARFPGFQCVGITLPSDEGNPLVLYGAMEDDFFLYPNTVNSLFFDADDGTLEEARFFRRRSLRHQVNTFIAEMHYGQYGGLAIKIIYFLGGLTPSVLSITGFLLWLSKKAPRRKHAPQRRAVPTAAT